MAEHLDALFNPSAAGENDAEFLFAVHSYHFQVHMRIAECADCEALRDLIEKNQVLIMNWLYDVAANRHALPPRFHRDLIETLVTGDPTAADAAMRRHVRYGLEETARNLKLRTAVEWRARASPPAGAEGAAGSDPRRLWMGSRRGAHSLAAEPGAPPPRLPLRMTPSTT